MYLVKSPPLLQFFYPALTWHMPRNEKVVYLTFDDGPIPDVTTFVLKTLKSYGAKATFFCIGDNIVKHPAIFQNLTDEGHRIGNHTFNHLRGWATSDRIYTENFLQCQQLTNTNLFRPPYGRIKRSQIKSLHTAFKRYHAVPETTGTTLNIIMWDVLSGDFDQQLSPEKCYRNVINNAVNGSVIVFHDSLKAFERLEYALPRTLKYFKEKGYQFGVL